MFTACFGLAHDNLKLIVGAWIFNWELGLEPTSHVTDVNTWGLYTKCMICMLHVVVHCADITCTVACYGIGTIIPDCDCQHEISYYRIYCSRLGVPDMDRFC